MPLEPEVGAVVRLDNEDFAFTSVPNSKTFAVNAEPGRKAKVYRLKHVASGKFAALKAFYPEFRGPQQDRELVDRTRRLTAAIRTRFPNEAQWAQVGLTVANRRVIEPQKNARAVAAYPSFEYAILMDWVEGLSWANFVEGRTELTPATGHAMARQFARMLAQLEDQALAHCDLSGGNFVLRQDPTIGFDLVDIEDLFATELPPPAHPVGTLGYVPEWLMDNGVWSPKADRMAGAVILCEMLCWPDLSIREASFSTSYFAPGEIGHRTKRYRLIVECLRRFDVSLADLFVRVWQARQLVDCPALAEWRQAFDGIGKPAFEYRCHSCGQGTQKGWKLCPFCGAVLEKPSFGPPPKPPSSIAEPLRIEPTDLVFDLGTRPSPPVMLKLTNLGSTKLIGTVSHEPWLHVTPSIIDVSAGQTQALSITLSAGHPTVAAGETHYFTRGVILSTNGGSRAIGGSITAPRAGWLSRLGL